MIFMMEKRAAIVCDELNKLFCEKKKKSDIYLFGSLLRLNALGDSAVIENPLSFSFPLAKARSVQSNNVHHI
jgi:hypothetical protein